MAKISTYPLDGSPKLSDKLIGTSVGEDQPSGLFDPTYNFSLQQLLDLFSPLLPGNTLQGVLDNDNTATQDINLYGKVTTTDLEVTNISNLFSAYVADSLYIEGELFDVNNSQGTAGQILTSTGSGIEWVTPTDTIPTLQQVLTSGNEADVDIILDADIESNSLTSDVITSNTNLYVKSVLRDWQNSAGTSGQMLISLGNKVEWQNVPVYTASSPLSINPATKNITIQQANGTQNGYLSFADWINFDGKQNALSGTGIVVSNGGTISYVVNNSNNWNQAYNDAILSASVSGGTTKTLTLTQRDGDVITTTWTEGGGGGGTLSSVGLTMPSAFSVSNSPLTSDGTIEVTASGTTSEYIDGTGALQTFPTIVGGIKHATASGTDTYVATISGVTSYAEGDSYVIRFINGNTTNATLNINGLGAVQLYKNNDGPLIGGDVLDNGVMIVVYDASLNHFQCIGIAPNTLLAYVTNGEATAITKGQAVYVSGGVGDRIKVKLAYNTSDLTSAQTIGIVASASIAANGKGIVIVQGQLDGLSSFPTSTWADGDYIYLGATAGTITNVKPSAPNHLVYLGYVTTASNGNSGRMYVKAQNGYELKELHDVSANNPSNNDGIFYNTSTSLWEAKSIPSALGYTPANSALTISTTAPLQGGGDLSANRTLSITQAGASSNGFLSSTDWNTFNNKQNTLTNPITGTGASGQVAFWNETNTQTGDSGLTWDNVNKRLNIGVGSSNGILNVFNNAANDLNLVSRNLNANGFSGFVAQDDTAARFLTFGVNNSVGLSATYGNSGEGAVRASTSANGLALSISNGNLRVITTTSAIERFRVFGSTGNVLIQNGGTFTDAGFRLDVNGSSRFNGLQTIQGTTASDTAPLGSELAAVTGTGTNWTLAGTNLNVGGYTHTVGDVTPLTTTLAAVSGTYYQIAYTITGRTAGSITINYGGTTSTGITVTGAIGVLASSTAALTITPSTDFDGNVVLSVKTISTSSASVSYLDSSGTTRNELRISNVSNNIFLGLTSGRRNITGTSNTGIGTNALQNTISATSNVAIGTNALQNITSGGGNVAIGFNALNSSTVGTGNTAIGTSTLQSNTTGINNAAIGIGTLYSNTTGTNNAAIGTSTLQSNTTGINNAALGSSALSANTTGIGNTAIGTNALQNKQLGSNNTSLGYNSGRYTGSGTTAMTSVNNSMYLGYQTRGLNATGTTNEIVIGYDVVGLGSNTTVLGNSSTITTAIYGDLLLGQTTDNGTDKLQVTGSVNITGQLKLGSTITNNTYTYTLPSATGTLALTSQIPTISGTTNYLPKFTGSTTLGNSSIYDNGTNVGIGTTSPIDYSIYGYGANIENRGGRGGGFVSTDSGATHRMVFSVDSSAGVGMVKTVTNTPLVFAVNDSERMRITSGGNVGINTTAPTSKLQVVGLPSYADNTTALAGGLTVGAFYHTAGVLKVVI